MNLKREREPCSGVWRPLGGVFNTASRSSPLFGTSAVDVAPYEPGTRRCQDLPYSTHLLAMRANLSDRPGVIPAGNPAVPARSFYAG